MSFYNDPDDSWQKALINYPVTSENSLWTEGRGRAEVRVGPSAIRIGDDTLFDFVKLQDDLALGFLQRGTLNVRIRQFGSLDAADRLQIDTGEGRFTLEGNGRYRIDASADGESRISVFSGIARFEGVNRSDPRLTIDAGKQLTVRIAVAAGGGTDFRYDNAGESPFDRWAESRDRQWDQTHTRYARFDSRDGVRDNLISPYMTGYEELDAAGDWIDDNEYGRLWTPRVIVTGWAPYRYGRWSYVRPWGWTWIDDAPWGFAPFHYGRWVQVRSRWCWWPGPYIGRPVYAPALVAWFGSEGSGLTLSSGPAVGWFPLAPREYYVPRYTSNANYLRRINYVTNNVTVINAPSRYRNQLPGATVVTNNVFISGRPIAPHLTHLPPGTIGRHPPSASFDVPRPSRRPAAQMPDRREDGRPVTPAPVPRFNNDTPTQGNRGQAPASPGTQTPKFTPAPAVIGPQPQIRPAPEAAQGGNAVPGSNVAPGGYLTPSPAANPPTAQPRTRPQPPAYSPTPTPTPPNAVPRVAPLQVEPAPVMPDRDARPAPRSPGPRSRPQPEVQYPSTPPSAPVAPPATVPRASLPQQQPASPQAAPAQSKVTPAPARAPKPAPEVQEENKNDGRGRVKAQKD